MKLILQIISLLLLFRRVDNSSFQIITINPFTVHFSTLPSFHWGSL